MLDALLILYFRKATLERHILVHSDYKPFRCPHCDFVCRESTNLRRHIDYHFCRRRFSCVACSASFHAKKTLQTHYTYKHTNERNHICKECSKAFKTINSLQRHSKTHLAVRQHHCHVCNMAFHRFYNLRRHMRTIHKDDTSLPPTRRLVVFDAANKIPKDKIGRSAVAMIPTVTVTNEYTALDMPPAVQLFRAGGTVPNQQLHTSCIESIEVDQVKTVSYNVTELFYPNAMNY